MTLPAFAPASVLAGERLRWGDVSLQLRPAVAWREQRLTRGVGVYLSLYADEIDQRAARFWGAHQDGDPAQAASDLELTDAVLILLPDQCSWVLRGGACTFPLYWMCDHQRGSGRLHLSTRLALDADEPFSRAGLIAAAAAACQHSCYEPNAFVITPLARWRRIRRACVTQFQGADIIRQTPIHQSERQPEASAGAHEAIVAALRTAFDAYGRSQLPQQRALLEVSGGFDSTLAAAAIPDRSDMLGVSAAFPYYEFRYEGPIQAASAAFLGIPRVELDGLDMFPYAPPERAIRYEEPSVFATASRHAETVASYAHRHGVRRIYMGHGGDQCFATDLGQREGLVDNPPGRGPFSRAAWRVVQNAMRATAASPWMERSLGTFVYDARQDTWIKESFGITIRTPFSDLAVFRAGLAWSRWCAAHGARPDKSILADALGDLLPREILERKGKVAYDGVWMRAYARHGEHIAATFERCAALLEFIGASPRWLIRRTRELAGWKPCSDREILALYAIATWLDAWGIDHPKRLAWQDDDAGMHP